MRNLETVSYVIGYAVLVISGVSVAVMLVCVPVFYALKWFNRAWGEFWVLVDYHLNKKRYRKWLATNPERDKRAAERVAKGAPPP